MLNYRPTRSSTLEFARATADEVIAMVDRKKGVPVVGLVPAKLPSDESTIPTDAADLEVAALAVIEDVDFTAYTDHLFVNKTQREVDRGLKTLAATAAREFLDRGLSVLYLALGSLRWTEANGDARVSPLLFIPVELRSDGPKQPHRVYPSEEDIVVNPALEIRLREHGISLPDQAAVEGLMREGGVAAVESAVRELKLPKGWEVEPLCVLSAFMFAKEAMFRDLEANEGRVLANPLVQALAGGSDEVRSQLVFAAADADSIDSVAPPEETPLILDADATQRVAISAAAQGRSFVLDGPPGTGKSQTIANIIATLLEDGKKVLFVSEKAVALDVVRDRLSERALGPLLFELHSHKATRAEVAKSLGRALIEKPIVDDVGPIRGKARLAELRISLTGYAAAMNERREPSGWSVHHALGQLADLPRVELYPPMAKPLSTLTPEVWDEILDLCNAVEAGWDHVKKGDGHLWRRLESLDGLEFDIHFARQSLNELLAALDTVAPDRDGLDAHRPSDWARILRLAEHWRNGDQEWKIAELDSPAGPNDLAHLSELIAAAEVVVTDDDRWRVILGDEWPAFGGTQVPALLSAATNTIFPAAEATRISTLQARSGDVEAWLIALTEAVGSATEVASSLGMTAPRFLGELLAIHDAAACIVEREPLEPELLATGAPQQLFAVLEQLQSAQAAERMAGNDAAETFLPSVRELDIDPIEERWASLAAWRRSVLGPSRDDIKLLAPHAKVKPRQAFAEIRVASGWQAARHRLGQAEGAVAELLGAAPRDDASWKVARRTLERCQYVLERAGSLDIERLRESRSNVYGWDALTRRVSHLGSDLERLAEAAAKLGGVFVDPSQEHSQLASVATSAKQELDDALNTLNSFGDAGALGLLEARTRMFDVNTASQRRSDATTALRELARRLPHLDGELSGAWIESARARQVWIATLRSLTEGLADAERHRGLASLAWADSLADAGRSWVVARDKLVGHFSGDVYAAELDDFEDAGALLQEFADNVEGARRFLVVSKAAKRLAELGLGAAVDGLRRESTPSDEVARTLRSIALSSWMHEVEAADSRFTGRFTLDRDAQAEQFRELDRALVDQTATRVLASAIRRRPSTPSLQTSLILSESEKKKRHIPVRDLIARARDVVQALHPCFMMSPLAVSQFLPPDMEFDVVIFDEASQVPPGDAINCIYRGKALIAAGDQRQLPPTSFFAAAQAADDDIDADEDLANDYESLLDLMKSSGSYTNIGLRWHYRSRHEHLIAYSNNSFYEDRLITFPGALADVPDAGVKFHRVDGVYRRSQGQDNPKEAQYVAKRVIHHLDTRVGKSVGVVAMSVAQRDAILNALTLERNARPDLDDRFVESRLDGIFVKSLEEVQGDERDVIIMSIGYGPDDSGTVYRNFGPINKVGGERRLNVAITRAKELTEVVASMDAGDIGEVSSAGGRHLRRYLDYAERGPVALAIELGDEGRGTDSPFEDAVISAIRSWGYDVQPQVGVSGFRIDIGVKHPARPGVFMLGVECDGAMYHSSKTARDRDRLRHEILEGLGWNLHHIWGTDWYRNREREMERLQHVLEAVEQSGATGRVGGRRPPAPPPTVGVEHQEFDAKARPGWMRDYVPLSTRRLRGLDWTDVSNARHLTEFIEAVAVAEGPVHLDLIKARLREHSDLERVNKYGLRTMMRAIELANVRLDGDFVLRPRSDVEVPRVAGGRTLAQVHEKELRLVVLGVIETQVGSDRAELPMAVSRAFGWLRTPAELPQRVDVVVRSALKDGHLIESGGALRVAGGES